MNDDKTALEAFAGVTRLFPLPSLVLLPGVVQGLHVFEPRYRQLMADTLTGDMLFSLVLLKPGWENDYDARPPIGAGIGRRVAPGVTLREGWVRSAATCRRWDRSCGSDDGRVRPTNGTHTRGPP